MAQLERPDLAGEATVPAAEFSLYLRVTDPAFLAQFAQRPDAGLSPDSRVPLTNCRPACGWRKASTCNSLRRRTSTGQTLFGASRSTSMRRKPSLAGHYRSGRIAAINIVKA